MFIIAAVSVFILLPWKAIPSFTLEDRSFFPEPEKWISSPFLSYLLNILVIAGSSYFLAYIAREYNPFRLNSYVAATIFISLMLAFPSAMSGFYSGTFVLATVVVCILILLSSYQDKSLTRRIFLIFFLLSTASLFQLSLLLYVPVMLAGTLQMKVFSAKTVVAALLGLITPFWLIGALLFHYHFSLDIPALNPAEATFATHEFLPVAVAFTSIFFISLILLMLNFLKMVSYNARIRSANGLMTVTLIATMIFIVIDYNNMPVYLPLLAWGAAFQGSHFIMSRNGQRTYVAVAAIILLCLYLFVWTTLI